MNVAQNFLVKIFFGMYNDVAYKIILQLNESLKPFEGFAVYECRARL